ncbi:hypothetical protein Nepgr_024421 [Nepenthes gracilis]|uniref:Uncharacterized protein n=1 Tax=Nepenthes gracilis TaxID=150966 RepID=A0AAD3T2T2_NEPGR|nr:hypothetical protein Nepgr_024421 [Nepenthes gracilis]
MGKRGGRKNGPNCTSVLHGSLTLREEAAGKKQTSSIKSILKLKHLQNLALWAAGEASMPSLAAFYGRHFSSCGEALGVPRDPSLFPCQRCETILQPGFNCTIRIEKNGAKKQLLDKKPITCTGNNVVYMCHFCLHRNVKKGTPKGHVRESCPSKAKLPLKPEPVKSALERDAISEQGSSSKVKGKKTDNIGPSSAINIQSTAADSLATPSALLDSKSKRRRRSGSKKPVESEASIIAATAETDKASGASRKRRRKSWITLKEIAQSSGRERSQKLSDFSIPFIL